MIVLVDVLSGCIEVRENITTSGELNGLEHLVVDDSVINHCQIG